MNFQVVPVAHYTQNETASFHRKHKAGQELSFDRGAIEEHGPLKMLNEAELRWKLEEARKVKEKKEEEDDLHPDDRAREDEYVNEIKDPDERDYKDGN
ncbi:unnamed protein product [Auanema sp. JU1783]|nr:unnamed protein product [Auanema sp. JU1783]